MAAAAAGGTGLALAAAGFFVSSSSMVVAAVGAAAFAVAAAGAVLGACGVRRPLGEVAVIGIVAGALSLPLAVFDLLAATPGHLG